MTVSMRFPAVSYAGLGWPVFRCRTGGKAPGSAHGFKDATSDVDAVDDEFRRHPNANIGHPTGRLWDVLDLDVKPGGCNARLLVPRLMDGGRLSGAAGIAETRNGGLHLYYPASGLHSGSIPTAGVDFKAAGGYVLLPPSRVPSDFPERSGVYRWIRFPNGDGEPLDWPTLRAELDPRQEQPRPTRDRPADPGRRIEGLLRAVRDAAPGARNHVLYWAACRATELDQLDQLRPHLAQAAQSAGLGEQEITRTIASAARRSSGGRS